MSRLPLRNPETGEEMVSRATMDAVVVSLHRELAACGAKKRQLRETLALFADRGNWQRSETVNLGVEYIEWLGTDDNYKDPWVIAAAALEEAA